MILAAGLGTRLQPLTSATPKPLLPVAGRPLIVWTLLLLRRAGILEAMINLHHLGHLIEQELGDGSQLGLRLAYSHEPVILGTGGGIKQAESFFRGEPFLVINGDTLFELDLAGLLAFHHTHGGLATMVLREDREAERWGLVELDGSRRILRITGRGCQDGRAAGTRMFAGIHVMHPRLLRTLPAGHASSIIDAYVAELQRGESIFGFDLTGYWSDVGTVERYRQVCRDAEAGLIDLSSRLDCRASDVPR
jgi:NDP-sugar pyrophosphorylase family protein